MASYSRRSVSFSRRSFVEKLGLGLGAALLAPLASNIIKEAQGQSPQRRIAMFWLACNGMHPYWVFTPPQFAENLVGLSPSEPSPVQGGLVDSKAFTLPAAFAPLGPNYRNRLVMLDGFKNHPRKGEDGGHGSGYTALNCVPGVDVSHFVPGNLTLDQHLATTLSAGAPRKSVLIASSSRNNQVMKTDLFAEGPSKALGAFQSPVHLFQDLFGNGMAAAGGMSVGNTRLQDRLIFDGLKADIQQLESQFAVPEREKLASYLSVIESYETILAGSIRCNELVAPTVAQTGDAVDVLEALNAIATIALVCGTTNVMGVDIGCGDAHDQAPNLRKLFIGSPLEHIPGATMGDVGHYDGDIQGPFMSTVYAWMSGMVARTLDALLADTLVDSALAVITSDNGEAHHSMHQRWPLVLAGKAGALRMDGRFIRYPAADNRSLIDVYSTLGASFGIPNGQFGTHADGMGPNAPAQGPLSELL